MGDGRWAMGFYSAMGGSAAPDRAKKAMDSPSDSVCQFEALLPVGCVSQVSTYQDLGGEFGRFEETS